MMSPDSHERPVKAGTMTGVPQKAADGAQQDAADFFGSIGQAATGLLA
jgi:hypothetical protein